MCKLEAKGARGGWTNQCHHPLAWGFDRWAHTLIRIHGTFVCRFGLVYGPMIHVLASGWLRRCYLGLRVLGLRVLPG